MALYIHESNVLHFSFTFKLKVKQSSWLCAQNLDVKNTLKLLAHYLNTNQNSHSPIQSKKHNHEHRTSNTINKPTSTTTKILPPRRFRKQINHIQNPLNSKTSHASIPSIMVLILCMLCF